MKQNEFETSLEAIKAGIFSYDRRVLEYTDDALKELRELVEALWECCTIKDGRIRQIRDTYDTMKRGYDAEIQKLREENATLRDLVDEARCTADSLRAELVQAKVELDYMKQKE